MTVGPWKPIRLEIYEHRVENFWVRVDVAESLEATINVSLSATSSSGSADVTVKAPDGTLVVDRQAIPLKDGNCDVSLDAKRGDLELWWPVGYGKQILYTVDVVVKDEVRMRWVAYIVAETTECFLREIIFSTPNHKRSGSDGYAWLRTNYLIRKGALFSLRSIT
jgi:hypothetical protein